MGLERRQRALDGARTLALRGLRIGLQAEQRRCQLAAAFFDPILKLLLSRVGKLVEAPR